MKTVLVVGHYKPLEGIYRELFQELGFTVFSCEDGQDAVQYIAHSDILFVDLDSPMIDGFELARIAKRQNQNMKVFIVADIKGFVPEGHVADKVIEKRDVFAEIMTWLPGE